MPQIQRPHSTDLFALVGTDTMAGDAKSLVAALAGKYSNPNTTGFDDFLLLAGVPYPVRMALNYFRNGDVYCEVTDGGMTITMPGMVVTTVFTLRYDEKVPNKAPDGASSGRARVFPDRLHDRQRRDGYVEVAARRRRPRD